MSYDELIKEQEGIFIASGQTQYYELNQWEGSTVSWEVANDDPVLAANAAGERYTLLDADA